MLANNEFKEAMSLIPTSVAIAWLTNDQHEILGCTISSFISVSVEHENEMIAFVLRSDSRTGLSIGKSRTFNISILSRNQSEIASIFARGLSIEELNSSMKTHPTWNKDSVCEFSLRLQQEIVLRNSRIFIADVTSFCSRPTLDPLVYSARKYL